MEALMLKSPVEILKTTEAAFKQISALSKLGSVKIIINLPAVNFTLNEEKKI